MQSTLSSVALFAMSMAYSPVRWLHLKEFGNVSCKANTTTVDKPMKASDTRTHGPQRSLRRRRSPNCYSATQLLLAPLLIGAVPPSLLCCYIVATV